MASNATVIGILRILLTADASNWEQVAKKASRDADKLSGDFKKAGRNVTDAGRAMTAGLTLPLVGLGAASAKAAIDFESSFAGVRKTIKATEPEFAAMAASIRQLSREIPISVNELNRIGEAAGALGIPKDQVVEFVRVMALLGTTTNLTSDQASESIAKIQNIFGAAGKDTDKFAAALVALGNEGASTESQILEMATRIAGAGSTIGLTQGQVLGFASALSSVGLEAEAGGTAISRVFVDMAASVSSGGERLAQFAKVAGMSADSFSQKFKTDAAGAVLAFIEGLGKIRTSGGDVLAVLAEMDIKEVRLRDTLLRAAGASDVVAQALKTQEEAWRANSALTDEARERFRTTEAQLDLLWNRLKDVGITLGNALLPVINDLIKITTELIPHIESAAKWFAGLDENTRLSIVGFGAFVAAAGPVLVVVGQIASAIGSLVALFGTGGVAAKGFGAAVGLLSSPFVAVVAAAGGLVLAIKELTGSWALAFGALMPPLGLFIARWDEMKASVETFRAWFPSAKDSIVRTAQMLYEGVKTWLTDKFTAIVESLRQKVEAVKGYFKDLYDKVIGNSYVPDLIAGIGREFGKLPAFMVTPSMKATSQTAGYFSEMATSIGHRLADIGRFAGDVFNDMLSGAVSFKDGFVRIWDDIKRSISQILTDILNDFTNRFVSGLVNAVTGRGGLAQAFSGMIPGFGGGAGGFGGAANGLPGGLAPIGSTPWWSTAAGGGALGAGAGAGVGWYVGSQTGNKWGSAAAGAGTGAAVGSIGGPVGSVVGAIVGGVVGWWQAKQANKKANNNRDDFLAQFGPGGTGEGSGFHNLAAELTKATGESGGGRLFKELIDANDPEALAKAIAAVNAELERYRAETAAATTAEQKHAESIAATKAEHEKAMESLQQRMAALDKEEKDWDAREAPEEHMGTVEKRAREKIAESRQRVQAAMDAQEKATADALNNIQTAAGEAGPAIGNALGDGIAAGARPSLDRLGEWIEELRRRYASGDWGTGDMRLPNERSGGSIPGFTGGTPNLDFMDFGARGQLVMLHRREAVVPEGKAAEFAARHAPSSLPAPNVVNVYVNEVPDDAAARRIAALIPGFVADGGDTMGRWRHMTKGLVK